MEGGEGERKNKWREQTEAAGQIVKKRETAADFTDKRRRPNKNRRCVLMQNEIL